MNTPCAGQNRSLEGFAFAICFCAAVLACAYGASAGDLQLPEKRAARLLKQMTLEEKIAQLRCVWIPERRDLITNQTLVVEKAREYLGPGIGEFASIRYEIPREVALRNEIQRFLKEQTRLGIPALFHDEGCHGMLGPQATSFPVPMALACSWDEDLLERVFSTVAEEMRSRGIHHALTPVVDICRDPRWGRTDETLGEDPFLNGKLGAAMVRGLQGSASGLIAAGHVLATLKHCAGHGQPEAGLNRGPAMVPLRELWDSHLVPFRIALTESRPATVMPSYNENDGIPSHANSWLLRTVLRHEYGFPGLIVSDYGGIAQLERVHKVASDAQTAAMLAFHAGVEMDLPSGEYFPHLASLVRKHRISEKQIDAAVLKVLKLKFQLGLFENPFVEAERAVEISRRSGSRKLALEAARKSLVLLKNSGGLLPLKRDTRRTLAVIGPQANDTRLGSYSGEPWQKVSILEAVKTKAGENMRVTYAQGCQLVKNLPESSMQAWSGVDQPVFVTDVENEDLLAEAAETARQADLVLLVVGENEVIAREAWEGGHFGDRPSLELFGSQRALVEAVFAAGKPVVVYLMNGKPMDLRPVADRAGAILEGWYLGQETGTAVAEALFGEINPSGKLTISFPRSAGHIPAYYNHKPGARIFDYVDESSAALYPFGFGLSYTAFKYSSPRLSAATITTKGKLRAEVEVTNSGARAGGEIVQLYVADTVSSVTRPIKELKGFRRIHLEPGQTQTVSMELKAEDLRFHDARMNYVVEPGEFKVWMAGSSISGAMASFTVTR